MMEQAIHTLLVGCMIVLAVCIFLCLIRAIIGPRISDRIVAINMIGTMTMIIIAMMSVLLHEGYLVDVAMIYAMISFLAVVVLTKVYMGVYVERKKKEESTKEGEQNGMV
ncbi:MAG: monovalent cation/H+ antiporter complex subunit F [Lachnospiraceae bacterium]